MLYTPQNFLSTRALKLSVAGTTVCAITSFGIVTAPAASAGTTQAATTQAATIQTAAIQAAAIQAVAIQVSTAQVVTTASRVVTVKLTQQQRAAKAVKFAYAQIGDWYLYGGNGPSRWDCSGLAVGAWRSAGIKIPRVTTSIYRSVRKRVSWSSLRPGDLVFFYHLGHVGIYVGKGYMIHAPHTGQRVKRVKIDRYYRQQFSGAVRPGA